MKLHRICWLFVVGTWLAATALSVNSLAREVVAIWGFADEYIFDTNPNKQDFAADVDATVTGDANLQAYLGVADEFDDNGGGGFLSFTSATSGISYDPTRTLKFDDLKGSGDDFDIAGISTFSVDKKMVPARRTTTSATMRLFTSRSTEPTSLTSRSDSTLRVSRQTCRARSTSFIVSMGLRAPGCVMLPRTTFP